IAATNKDLGALVAEGRFRKDLFYRLSVVTIALPPLRERRDDIPALAAHFLESYVTTNDQPPCRISPEAMAALVAYDWPGNVRELEHAVERAAALRSTSVLLAPDLPPEITVSAAPQAATAELPPLRLQDVVRNHLRRVLREA